MTNELPLSLAADLLRHARPWRDGWVPELDGICPGWKPLDSDLIGDCFRGQLAGVEKQRSLYRPCMVIRRSRPRARCAAGRAGGECAAMVDGPLVAGIASACGQRRRAGRRRSSVISAARTSHEQNHDERSPSPRQPLPRHLHPRSLNRPQHTRTPHATKGSATIQVRRAVRLIISWL